MKTQWRVSLYREIRRKLIHLTGLSVPAAILLLGRETTAGLICLALIVAIFLERVKLQEKISLPEMRDYEKHRVSGYVYYILGALLAVLFFRPMIAVTAMLMLSLGDAASGIIGSVLRGSDVRAGLMEGERWRLKPMPVVLGTFGVCLLVGYCASHLTGYTSSGLNELSFLVYLAGAVGATAADAIPISFRRQVLDDNFTIPLYSGTMMTLISLI
ncbi:MAG: diacylglycerol/polyprenol kinase family protein [Methanotrichaceae archaeon]